MSTRTDRQVDTKLNEKHAKVLRELMMRPENRRCADCSKKDPRWAPWNLGIFVCIRCSGIHRSLGTHISKVKSADLDTWTPEQVENMIKWGNRKANLYWEHAWKGEPPESNMEEWIRAKYERKQYAMKGEIPDPATLGGAGIAVAAQSTQQTAPPVASKANAQQFLFAAFDAPPAAQKQPASQTQQLFAAFESPAPAAAPQPTKSDIKNDIMSLFASSPKPQSTPQHQVFSGQPQVGQQHGAGFPALKPSQQQPSFASFQTPIAPSTVAPAKPSMPNFDAFQKPTASAVPPDSTTIQWQIDSAPAISEKTGVEPVISGLAGVNFSSQNPPSIHTHDSAAIMQNPFHSQWQAQAAASPASTVPNGGDQWATRSSGGQWGITPAPAASQLVDQWGAVSAMPAQPSQWAAAPVQVPNWNTTLPTLVPTAATVDTQDWGRTSVPDNAPTPVSIPATNLITPTLNATGSTTTTVAHDWGYSGTGTAAAGSSSVADGWGSNHTAVVDHWNSSAPPAASVTARNREAASAKSAESWHSYDTVSHTTPSSATTMQVAHLDLPDSGWGQPGKKPDFDFGSFASSPIKPINAPTDDWGAFQ